MVTISKSSSNGIRFASFDVRPSECSIIERTFIKPLVCRFNLDFLYTTITMGVDPGYVKENFYDKVGSHNHNKINMLMTIHTAIR